MGASARRERKVSSGSTNRGEALGPSPRLELALSARSVQAGSTAEPAAAGSARAADLARLTARASDPGAGTPPSAGERRASKPPRPFAPPAVLGRAKQSGSLPTPPRAHDSSAHFSADAAKAMRASDDHIARSTKFVLGVLRDRFSLRTQYTATFRRLDVDKSGRIDKDEMGAYLDALNCGVDDDVLDLVMKQLDPDGNGIELSELVDNLLKLGAWGTHDPFMSQALRADVADAKHAQIRAHDEATATLHARRALRMATSARDLRGALHRASQSRLLTDKAELEQPEHNTVSGSKAAATANAIFGMPPDPLAGTLNRAEYDASVGARGTAGSSASSRIALGRTSSSSNFMATEQQLRALAPAEGKRIDIEKFCVSLAELPPAALGFGMSLPVGDRRPVALPRLPGKLSRYVPDPELRAQVEREYRINDQRIATDFRLKRPDEAPLLMSRLGG
ncbi:hypothetical protein KFE25_009677 [Diacronema lutheri]|uniref:EF-hand domain-containing protein n=1 Tax=Diacronema lutheri TaxID=2081491 RepID=A0A8J5XY95_DIALT|nr:hypothetical protein KFE25_009677 [Diacronema lutheri]